MRARARRALVPGAALLAGLGACGGGGSEAPRTSGAEADAPAGGGRPWFQEEAAARGLVFRHASGQGERYLYPEIATGGGALFDKDGDGDLDAYLVQAGGVLTPRAERAGNQLFENAGGGRFRDVSAGSGADDRGYGMGVACGDPDGDGDTDLYVTNLEANALLENDGRGTFADATAAAGVGEEKWSASAAFFDADRDGDLDLFVVNYVAWSVEAERTCYTARQGPEYCGPKAYDSPVPDSFYRNEGDGTFLDRSREAGLLSVFGNGLGLGILDADSDGWLDVFVANDGSRNQLWINRRDGTFADEALLRGCAADQDGTIKAGMGVGILDADDDGDEDVLVVNLTAEHDSFYLNQGTHFADRTASVGLTRVSHRFTRFGVGFLDFDQDGSLDLYQANGRVTHGAEESGPDPFAEENLLHRGVRAPGGLLRFDEVRPRGGTLPPLVATSRAAAFGDVDGDGALDVLVVNRDAPAHLLLNRTSPRGNWVLLAVREVHGSPALGARVLLRVGGQSLARRVSADGSYCAASDPRVHVGLGSARAVDEVLVRWTDGGEERFGPLAAGREWVLARGAGR
jgi:hypothetical protein